MGGQTKRAGNSVSLEKKMRDENAGPCWRLAPQGSCTPWRTPLCWRPAVRDTHCALPWALPMLEPAWASAAHGCGNYSRSAKHPCTDASCLLGKSFLLGAHTLVQLPQQPAPGRSLHHSAARCTIGTIAI